MRPRKEEKALLSGTDARPADVWSGGKDVAYDVTLVNPLQKAYVDRPADKGQLVGRGR